MALTEFGTMNSPISGKHPDIDKVLIIGPSGNVGSRMIPRLLDDGYEVCALQFNSPVKPRPGLEVVQGSTLDKEALTSAVEGVDAVCHLVRGGAGPGADSCEKWFNCCLRGAVILLEACKGKPLKRVIVGSADNVFGHTQIHHPGPINEHHPKHAADGYYGLFKIAEEEISRQYYLEHGVPVVITRFPLIWTESMVAGNLAGWVDRSRKVVMRKLDRDDRPLVRHDVVIDDVIDGVMRAIEQDVALGDDFIFAGPSAYSSDTMTTRLADKLGWDIEDQPLPWHSWQLDDSKARGVLNYRPGHDVLDWIVEHM